MNTSILIFKYFFLKCFKIFKCFRTSGTYIKFSCANHLIFNCNCKIENLIRYFKSLETIEYVIKKCILEKIFNIVATVSPKSYDYPYIIHKVSEKVKLSAKLLIKPVLRMLLHIQALCIQTLISWKSVVKGDRATIEPLRNFETFKYYTRILWTKYLSLYHFHFFHCIRIKVF